MPNYFKGTIGTLQNIIAQERQERARKRTPEYQMAVEKLMTAKRDQMFRQTLIGLVKSDREFPPEMMEDIMAGIAGGEEGLLKSKIDRMQRKEKRGYEEGLLGQKREYEYGVRGEKKEREKEFLRDKPITPYEKESLAIRRKAAERTARGETLLAREKFEAAQEKIRLDRLDKTRTSLIERWDTLKGKPTKVKFYKAKDSDKYILPSKGAVDREESIERMVAVGAGTTAQKLETAMKIVKNAQKKYPTQPIDPADLPDEVLEFLNDVAKGKGMTLSMKTAKVRIRAKQILEELANSGQLQ